MSDEKTMAPGPESADEPASAPMGGADGAALRSEIADLKDRLLRAAAEMENLRRRTEREMADARQYAVANFAREMLTVADNLKRAIAAVPVDARAADPALSNLMDGVEATERGLEQTISRFGVKQIDALGQKFNPEIHQAMFEVETDAVPPGAVAQVIQPGYTIGERTLRPALVGVAKAKPASAQESG
jgi:molecular chaperone GrpE